MKNYQIILASNSPRRKQLLQGLDIAFTVMVKNNISEAYPQNLPAEQVPLFIAKQKAKAYNITHNQLLITADTVVVVGSKVLGKPHDAKQAKHMLQLLSGQTHQVITGVCLTTLQKQRAFSVTTHVSFKHFTNEELDYYISTYQPFDKAGAYGIQEWIGYIGVTKLEGSYFNVMGMPVQRIYQELNTEF